jgi:hypothetical protein
MFVEKATPWGSRIVAPAGVVFAALAALALLAPGSLGGL